MGAAGPQKLELGIRSCRAIAASSGSRTATCEEHGGSGPVPVTKARATTHSTTPSWRRPSRPATHASETTTRRRTRASAATSSPSRKASAGPRRALSFGRPCSAPTSTFCGGLRVRALTVDGGRATGVVVTRGGVTETIAAGRIILCAGDNRLAAASHALRHRPAKHLRDIGVRVSPIGRASGAICRTTSRSACSTPAGCR